MAMLLWGRNFCFHLAATPAVARAGAARCLRLLLLSLAFLFLEGAATRWLWGTALLWCLGLPSRSCLSAELFCTAICKWPGEMRCWLLLLEIFPAMSMVLCVTHCSTAARKTGALAPTRWANRPLRSCLSMRLTGKSSPAREEREERLFLASAPLPVGGPPEHVASGSHCCSGTTQTSSASDMLLAAQSRGVSRLRGRISLRPDCLAPALAVLVGPGGCFPTAGPACPCLCLCPACPSTACSRVSPRALPSAHPSAPGSLLRRLWSFIPWRGPAGRSPPVTSPPCL